MSETALQIKGLAVDLPTGQRLLDKLDLQLRAGEVAVILGGSGAGKSTFSKVLMDRDELLRSGFRIDAEELSFSPEELGLVPQQGALFDHLDVRGNITIAQRYRQSQAKEAGPKDKVAPAEWLSRVGLPEALLDAPVGSLSGGQSQRVAVARALASERRLLLLDEPSVGLDPHRVRMLARLLREQVAALDLAAIVVTHDPALAAGVGDKLYLLDPKTQNLRLLFGKDWPGPMEREGVDEETRGKWLLRVEEEVVQAIANQSSRTKGSEKTRGRLSGFGRELRERAYTMARPFEVAGRAAAAIPSQLLGQPRDFLHVMAKVFRQCLLRPALFYAVVSVLIGFTILFVISKVGGAGVRTDALLRQIGGAYAVALAPPLSAILFISASGSATNAWLGSMELTRQGNALEALGIRRTHYLYGPSWLALAMSFFLVASIISLGMLFGGYLLCTRHGVEGAWDLLVGDLIDPRPERAAHAGRALFLMWMYGWGIASNVVAKGGARKSSADAVTKAMTESVVSATLWVVLLELLSVLWIYSK